MKTPTRQRLIDAAVKRFSRDGFRSVGIDQIIGDVGISKTAFYKHFESKDDLMVAALENQNEWLQNTFRTMIRERGGKSPVDQLYASFDVVETLIESDEFQGCIFVNVAMEFPLPHEPPHIVAARNKQAIEDIIHAIAAEAGAAEPRALAQQLCLVMEGAYVTRHVSSRPEAIDIARAVAHAVIQTHCCSGRSDGRPVSETGV